MMKTREDYESGVARLKFDKDAKFELKCQFLKELCDHTSSGSENEDANEHIERVLEIVHLFTTPDVTQDQFMLRVYPITLTGVATRAGRNSLPGLGTIQGTFIEMSSTLLNQYAGSDFVLQRTSLRNKSSNASDGLAAIQAQLNNLGREIKKMNERVYAAQVGCELCNGPHYTKDCPLKEEGKTLEEAYYTQFKVPFPQVGRYRATAPGFYQRDNGNTSYQERRQTMEQSLNKFMAEYANIHDEHSTLNKEIRASTNAAIKNQGASIKALEIQFRPDQYAISSLNMDEKILLIEISRASVPFPGRLKEKGYDEKEVLIKLKKLQINSTEYAKSLRRMLKEKSRIKENVSRAF
ncbi:hypothetical protein Tco_1459299, partial [Tanacetum coccineum]